MRPHFASQIRVLQLSKNNLRWMGIENLAGIFEINQILEVVDLSKNEIGVRGGQVLAESLRKNRSVRDLNLFNNKIGFDGAKAFGETLRTNTTLSFIDFGHNRIRDSGLNELTLGINKNEQSAIWGLGLRFNYLHEDAVIELLRATASQKKLTRLFIKNNSISEYGLSILKTAFDNLKLTQPLRVDLFNKLHYTEPRKLEHTIYIYPAPCVRSKLRQYFEDKKKIGIVTDVRIRMGPRWPNRTKGQNK